MKKSRSYVLGVRVIREAGLIFLIRVNLNTIFLLRFNTYRIVDQQLSREKDFL